MRECLNLNIIMEIRAIYNKSFFITDSQENDLKKHIFNIAN